MHTYACLVVLCLVMVVFQCLAGPSPVVRRALRVRGGGDKDDDGSASIQFMVTRKMRIVLVDDLKYLDGEVDVMEPQIARVVIERRLQRPSKGMPASWRRQGEGYGGKAESHSFPNPSKVVVGVVRGLINKTNKLGEAPIVVKVALVPLLFFLGRNRLPDLGIVSYLEDFQLPTLPKLPARRKKVPALKKAKEAKRDTTVDTRSFGAVRRQNPLEAAGTSASKAWSRAFK